MARKVRIEYASATYHVMARGNQGRAICGDDRDGKLWLETAAEPCAKTGWRIHAWVMMGNHYHLLLETPGPSLVVGMNRFTFKRPAELGVKRLRGRLEGAYETWASAEA